MRTALFFGLLTLSLANAACTSDTAPPACRAITYDEAPFTVCSYDSAATDIRLFHSRGDGSLYGQFDTLAAALGESNQTLTFAMNAGMYHDDRAPVGLYVEDGEQIAPLVATPGPGNFGMVPNGVFHLSRPYAAVTETAQFALTNISTIYATQSGPMLVINGELHPALNADGPSKKRRNGVGVSADGQTVYFAISEVPVNFHTFASLFRDRLETPNALYFDGMVSKLYATELERNEKGLDMGPIVGVVRADHE